jgi:hypothetical protein
MRRLSNPRNCARLEPMHLEPKGLSRGKLNKANQGDARTEGVIFP